MRYFDIINERQLIDVGVKADKFYIALDSSKMDISKFFSTHELDGIRGISSSRKIWKEFSPNVGRDVFLVMSASSVLKENDIKRVKYDDINSLLANNSTILTRIFNTTFDKPNGGSNVFHRLVPNIAREAKADNKIEAMVYKDDVNSLINKSQNMLSRAQEGGHLVLSSLEDYRKLLLAAAVDGKWYTSGYAKLFAPQNRSKCIPMIQRAIIKTAEPYAPESEWIVHSTVLKVPADSQLILAINKSYSGEPAEGDSAYKREEKIKNNALLERFESCPFKYTVVDAEHTSNQLVKLGYKSLPNH